LGPAGGLHVAGRRVRSLRGHRNRGVPVPGRPRYRMHGPPLHWLLCGPLLGGPAALDRAFNRGPGVADARVGCGPKDGTEPEGEAAEDDDAHHP
jgi:hypothetical protein